MSSLKQPDFSFNFNELCRDLVAETHSTSFAENLAGNGVQQPDFTSNPGGSPRDLVAEPYRVEFKGQIRFSNPISLLISTSCAETWLLKPIPSLFPRN